MALREILTWPDERLREVAQEVTSFDAQLKDLVDDMFETMYADEGVGLAATQIAVRKRVIVLDCGVDAPTPIAMINPKIVHTDGDLAYVEGCLSVPGIRTEIERAERIEVHFQDTDGQACSVEVSGLTAVCIQHEIDHLNGKLYFDHLPPLEQKAFLASYGAMEAEECR